VDEIHDPVQRDAQFSAHNRPKGDTRRIRASWWMIVLVFLLLGIAGAMVISRSHF
jgi:hypothetical protein